MKDVFGLKRNRCRVKLPDMFTVSLNVFDDRWGDYITTSQNKVTGRYIPAKGYDYWRIPLTEFPFLIEGGLNKKYSVAVNFSHETLLPVPNVLLATAEIDGRLVDSLGYITVSIYNPTNFDMEFHESHKINFLFVEHV